MKELHVEFIWYGAHFTNICSERQREIDVCRWNDPSNVLVDLVWTLLMRLSFIKLWIQVWSVFTWPPIFWLFLTTFLFRLCRSNFGEVKSMQRSLLTGHQGFDFLHAITPKIEILFCCKWCRFESRQPTFPWKLS
jgi:hypothetical protein